MDNRKLIGAWLFVLGILLALVLISFKLQLNKINAAECAHGAGCPMVETLPLPTYGGMFLILMIIGLGVYLIFFERVIEEKSTASTGKIKKLMNDLKGDERIIYNAIVDAGKMIFQSELVEKTQFSKVKITRILDRLESRGLLERRRRGMANVVILKFS